MQTSLCRLIKQQYVALAQLSTLPGRRKVALLRLWLPLLSTQYVLQQALLALALCDVTR